MNPQIDHSGPCSDWLSVGLPRERLPREGDPSPELDNLPLFSHCLTPTGATEALSLLAQHPHLHSKAVQSLIFLLHSISTSCTTSSSPSPGHRHKHVSACSLLAVTIMSTTDFDVNNVNLTTANPTAVICYLESSGNEYKYVEPQKLNFPDWEETRARRHVVRSKCSLHMFRDSQSYPH